MNKKAFTLSELIGVVVLLGLIALIAFPPIVKQIKNSKGAISEATEKLIITGASNYVYENKDEFPITSGNIYCVTLKQLVDDNKISSDLKNSDGDKLNLNKYVKITIANNNYVYTVENTCSSNN